MIKEDFLWVERYRPKTVEEMILPVNLKKTFQQFVDQKNIPNLLLSGPPGVGKTSIARAMLEELKCDYIIINGSMNGNIDTLRNDILNFASTVSFTGGRKYVILDESDYLNCLEENEKIKLSNGETISLKDMEENKQYNILSFNTKTSEFENDIAEVVNRSFKMVYELELENGSKVKLTGDHPIICKDFQGNITVRTINEGLNGYEVITIE